MGVNDFIKEHKHYYYCEAIIYPNGNIEYAYPSHIEKLIKVTNKDRDALYNEIPMYESPIHWLVNYTGCVSVWYDSIIYPPNVTDEQYKTLVALKDAKVIK